MYDYDILIIGAGPGGYEAAIRAGKLGKKVAVIDEREAGGTCLNRGCIPTKTLLHAAELYREALTGAPIGVCAAEARVDLGAMFERREEVSAKLRGGVEALFKAAKVGFLHGRGCVVAPHSVKIVSAEGEQTCSADAILIATGAVPATPQIPGLELPGVWSSEDVLRGLECLPASLTIIGGGVIGAEFATFFADLGVSVTLLEGMDRLLPTMDREFGQNLAMIFKKRGVAVQTGALVSSIGKTDAGFAVCYAQKGREARCESEAVLSAIGRRPYWDGVFAPGLEPAADHGRLLVDGKFETTLPGVYAVGDVSSPIQLASVAKAQGVACVERLCGLEPAQDLSLIPLSAFCRPEVASVGLTEAEAKERQIPVKIGKGLTSANGRSIILEADRGFMKLLAHAETGRLLGAQLMCTHANEMITLLTAAIANGLTAAQLRRAVHPHPSFEETLSDALDELLKKLG